MADRSLFTKVGPAVYRYGTCSLRLRLAQGDHLEAAGETELWEPLEAGRNLTTTGKHIQIYLISFDI